MSLGDEEGQTIIFTRCVIQQQE
ncbi:unnamed protein product [Ectocarpus sp. CCAP 1310/34]|nr:unnamed protein product [Ectocarpus sp. CCAP 1310/34]